MEREKRLVVHMEVDRVDDVRKHVRVGDPLGCGQAGTCHRESRHDFPSAT